MVELKYSEIFNVKAGLDLIDKGRPKEDGKPPNKPYELTGPSLLLLAKWSRALDAKIVDFHKARNSIIAGLSEDGMKVRDDPASQKAFAEKHDELLAQTETIDLRKIKESEIDHNKNKFPISVLAVIWPMVEWVAEKPKGDAE